MGSVMNKHIDENASRGLPNWIVAGGLAGVAAVLTALSGPAITLINILLNPAKNSPPSAVITVDQPQSSSTNNIYEIVAGTPLKLNPYSSHDNEDGGNLTYAWILDGEEATKREVYSVILPKRSEVYTIALRVTDRKGAVGNESISIQVVNPTVSDNSEPIPSQIEADLPINSTETLDHQEPSDQDKPAIASYFEWVHITSGNLPDDAFVAGTEYSVELGGDQPLYVCRGDYSGKKIPGKIVTGKCNIPTYKAIDGNITDRGEMVLSRYEVLVPKTSLAWIDHEIVPLDESGLPINAVFADGRAESLICRSFYEQGGNSGYHPGILDSDMDLCIFPWGGTAGYLRDYEVLVVNQ
jgi:Protein of unknown function (DUF3421)